MSSADSVVLSPGPSTIPSQLWQPCGFGNHRTGLIGIPIVWSVPVFVGARPGPSWQARACLPAFPPPSPACKLRASSFLELLWFPGEHGTGNGVVLGWSIWKEAAAHVELWSVTLDHRPSIFSFSSFKGKSGLVALWVFSGLRQDLTW